MDLCLSPFFALYSDPETLQRKKILCVCLCLHVRKGPTPAAFHAPSVFMFSKSPRSGPNYSQYYIRCFKVDELHTICNVNSRKNDCLLIFFTSF